MHIEKSQAERFVCFAIRLSGFKGLLLHGFLTCQICLLQVLITHHPNS